MLAALDGLTGVLSGPVRELVHGRVFNTSSDGEPLPPYSEAEWALLRQHCRVMIRESRARHERALAAAAVGADPRVEGWSFNNICWYLAEHGPATVVSIHRAEGREPRCRADDLHRANLDLFPATDLALAYMLLFAMESGIVPDGIAGMAVSSFDWAGDAVSVVTYHKGRTSTESVTLNRRASRLVRRWLEHSELSRRFAPPELRGELWLRRNARDRVGRWLGGRIGPESFPHWVEKHGLLGDDGTPLRIHRHRIRTTFETMRDRSSWIGSSRATIDPNHSPQVEGDHYLSVATPVQRAAVESVIAQAQADLVRKADRPRVLSADQLAKVAGGLPDALADLQLTDAEGLVSGDADTFVAACTDPLAGLHGSPGEPCPARPWVCLLCPLAVFAPRHAPNLLRLRAFFARQWQAMTSAQFHAVFGPYARRIDEVVEQLRRHDPAALVEAARDVADDDAEIPLRPEELSR